MNIMRFELDAEEALHIIMGDASHQLEVVVPADRVPELLRVVREKYPVAVEETGWVHTKQPVNLACKGST